MISPPSTPQPTSPQIDEELRRSLERVTIARPAATQVLAVVDNPNTNAQQVADAVELDPGFATHVLRLSNSAYYGLSGRVRNTAYAVTVLGFSAIRSLAALSAAGLDDNTRAKPEGFWSHAAATAAGCSVVANHFGLVAGDAFAAGLLHDLGLALLHEFDPQGHRELHELHRNDGDALVAAEVARYGIGHPDAAAEVLRRWHFPADFVAAVAEHHLPGVHSSQLSHAVQIGEVLAAARNGTAEDLRADQVERLKAASLSEETWDSLLVATRDRAAEILASLPVGL